MCPEITDLDLQQAMADIGVADPIQLEDVPRSQEDGAALAEEEEEGTSEEDRQGSSSSEDEAGPSQALIRRVALGLRGR